MTEKTYDAQDPRDLPYRFSYSPVTGEVFIIGIGRGFQVMGYFENKESFHRFLVEGNKTDDLIQEGTLKEVSDILKAKQE